MQSNAVKSKLSNLYVELSELFTEVYRAGNALRIRVDTQYINMKDKLHTQ